VFDRSGTYAEESLTAADPDFELWDVGHAALDAAPRTFEDQGHRSAVRACRRDRGTRRSAALELDWSSRLWVASADPGRRETSNNASSRSASS
jgi:hypothetical protein